MKKGEKMEFRLPVNLEDRRGRVLSVFMWTQAVADSFRVSTTEFGAMRGKCDETVGQNALLAAMNARKDVQQLFVIRARLWKPQEGQPVIQLNANAAEDVPGDA